VITCPGFPDVRINWLYSQIPVFGARVAAWIIVDNDISATMSAVPFVCQRCKQPLRVHDSLSDISPAAFDVLAGRISNSYLFIAIIIYRKQHQQHQKAVFHANTPAFVSG
jgi:hypothetical protein